jgi:hypothetical protein
LLNWLLCHGRSNCFQTRPNFAPPNAPQRRPRNGRHNAAFLAQVLRRRVVVYDFFLLFIVVFFLFVVLCTVTRHFIRLFDELLLLVCRLASPVLSLGWDISISCAAQEIKKLYQHGNSEYCRANVLAPTKLR